jgi:hypothetical protein
MQCCGSGMFIPDQVFEPSRIPDSTKTTKEESGKIGCLTFLFNQISQNIFLSYRKKIWANWQRIIVLFTQKLSLSSRTYGLVSGIRDPGSGKNLSRIQGSKKHPIPDPDTQQWNITVSIDWWFSVSRNSCQWPFFCICSCSFFCNSWLYFDYF